MAAVVVVTRNATLGVALVHHGYDVEDVRPDAYGTWTGSARGADAVVLELSDALAAEAAVQRLRASGIGVPVLLVANNTPGWETSAAHVGAAAQVLPLPITVATLTAALDALIAAGPVAVPPPPANEDELLAAVAASVGLAIGPEGTLVPDESGTVPRVRVDLTPPAEAVPAAEPDSAEPEAVVPPEPEPVLPPPPPPGARAEELAAALTARAGELSAVRECADVAVDELAERLGAEAAACLLPDGAEWRVAGGRNLRPLEHRIRLDARHGLITRVVTAGGAFVADDTAAARDALHGAPLASWRRVLAVPVPGVGGLLVAARAEEPFDEQAVATAADVAREAAPLLADALAARALARALLPYADLPD